jgi:hypothetical protein
MRRIALVAPFLVALVVGLVAAGPAPSRAQEATPAARAEHPFVGAWVVDTDTADPANFPALAAAAADGTYVESHPLVGVGVGAWEATGDRTANLTVVFRATDATGAPVGVVTAHAAVELDAGGDAWDAAYTFEAVAPDGTVLFAGRGQSRATRVAASAPMPPGTPVA